MYRITLIMLLALLLPDLYIYLIYVVKKTSRWWLRALYWVPTAILTSVFFYFLGLSGHNVLAHHAQSIGVLAVAIMLMAVPKIVFMLCSLTGILCRGAGRCLSALIWHTPFRQPVRRLSVHRHGFSVAGAVLATISFVNILYGAVWGVKRFEVKEVEYVSPRVPKTFDGYRIVQLSDMHLGSWTHQPEVITQLVEIVNRQQADVVVFLGDLVNQQSRELKPFVPILKQMHARHGVYSVLGNHDYGTYYRWKSLAEEQANLLQLQQLQHDMGWTLLNNRRVGLHCDTDSIALIGVENDGEPPFSQHADLPAALQGMQHPFSILLSHNPTHWRREVLPDTDIDLTLSGHTHAMQMELCGLSLSSLIYPEWSGFYYEGIRALYVNVGIGYVGLPFRFGAWPEITVITLRHEG